MILIVILVFVALIVLSMRFMNIRIPFISRDKKSMDKKISKIDQQQVLKDSLVEKAIDITRGNSRFLKGEKIEEQS